MKKRILLLASCILPVLSVPVSAQGWMLERSITITGSEAELLDYQVRVVFPFETGMQADFSDLRFFAPTGEPLPHWLES